MFQIRRFGETTGIVIVCYCQVAAHPLNVSRIDLEEAAGFTLYESAQKRIVEAV